MVYNLQNSDKKITTSTLIAKEYTAIMKDHINSLNIKLEDIVRNRKIYEQFILDNIDKVYPNKIINYINDVNKNNKSYNKFKLLEILGLKSSKELSDSYMQKNYIDKILYYSGNNDDSRLLYVYYHNFCKYVIDESNVILEIEKYENLILNDRVISTLFNNYFFEVSKELLKPNHISYTLPYNIHIKVISKDKNDARKKYNRTYDTVEWGESYKTLLAIAKEIDIDVYNKYKNKEIGRKELKELLSKYLYNKDTNPTGKKWLVKSDKDNNLWLVVHSKLSNLNTNSTYNILNYGIVPTNFIVNETRSQVDFTNSVSNVTEIIDSKLLGFRDKIRALERFDFNYCLNTFDNDL